MAGQGDTQFDTKLGLLRLVKFDGVITAKAEEGFVRLPLSCRVKLLEGWERVKALSMEEFASARPEASETKPSRPRTEANRTAPEVPAGRS